MDKESLSKHRFWYILGGVLLLFLIVVIWLLVGGSSAADEQKQKKEAAEKSLAAAAKGAPKNAEFLKPWEEYGKTFAGQKDNVWNEAWKLQEEVFQWPHSDSSKLGEKLKYMKDPLGNAERNEYQASLYLAQFKPLKDSVAPVEFKGGAAGFDAMMAPTMAAGSAQPGLPSTGGTQPGAPAGPSYANVFTKYTPTVEEIWLAQEDFWVKKGMLDVVRAALDMNAWFGRVPVKPEEPLPEGVTAANVVARHRFRGYNWEIDLIVEKGKERDQFVISKNSTIRNVSPTRRTLLLANPRTNEGLPFVLYQGNSTSEMKIAGEPVPPEMMRKFGSDTIVNNLDLRKECTLMQKLDWYSSPVRRIDELRTARQSHRTAKVALKALPDFADETPPPQPGTQPVVPGKPVGTVPPPPTTPPGTQPTQPAAPTNVTPNGLERDRYILLTDQARHLPVAMVLIVDQAHINDVLVAIANSPLRIQTTQVQFYHVTGVRPTPEPTTGATTTPTPMTPRFPPTAVTPGAPQTVEQDDPNLVELTVYGIATLYERPGNKRKVPAGATPSAPPPPQVPGGPTAVPRKAA